MVKENTSALFRSTPEITLNNKEDAVDYPSYLPKTLFSIPFSLSLEPCADEVPRLYTKDFLLFRADIKIASDFEFCLISSAKRPDLRKIEKLVELMDKLTGGIPCVIASPELDSRQKETLARGGISFIQNERNMFMPFLGTSVYQSVKEVQPKKLSPQAQRIVLNIISGTWNNISAGDLACRTARSPASVSAYLGEIAAISPSLIETDGRSRILRNSGFSKEEVLDIFEPYFSSPVKKSFKLSAPAKHLHQFAEQGFLLAGESALEAKTDLAFNGKRITLMTTASHLAALRGRYPTYFDELPWWHDAEVEIQVWTYPVDRSDVRTELSFGIAAVDDFSLYLSLKSQIEQSDIRAFDALEQVRGAACR